MTPEQEQALLADVSAMKRRFGEMQLRLEGLARAVYGPVRVREGEAVIPKVFDPWPQTAGAWRAAASAHENAARAHDFINREPPVQDQLLQEILALRQEAKATADQLSQTSAQMVRILRRWDDDGLPSSMGA